MITSTITKGQLIKSTCGSADPTQAAFPFHHTNAFAEAGHAVQGRQDPHGVDGGA